MESPDTSPNVLGHQEHDPDEAASNRPATSLANPEDVPNALPPGKVKFLAFFLVFLLWVGGWGALDQVVTLISKDDDVKSLVLYCVVTAFGYFGLRCLARKYRGYALLDEL
ncbi:unnamed protein product [Symbiodinium sp. CCMP2456]|nr:unnamed protein product [Symbiodinium sp. CCMP2456]